MKVPTIKNSKLYDVLKYTALFFLPALATLWSVLAPVWGLPFPEQILTTIVATNTFLGGLLGLSSIEYNRQNQ